MITTVYNEIDWLPWKFKTIPFNYWNDLKNQRKFLDWLASLLQIKEYKDWYKIDSKTIKSHNGNALLKIYNDSPSKLISNVYPNYEWLPWKFNSVPNKYWDNINNQQLFMKNLSQSIGIKEMTDWYKLTTQVTRYHK